MQGAGNDFVMLNAYDKPIELTPEQIRRICDRRFGVGCDQMLVVEKSTLENVDFRYRIFNQDGGEVEMCGNGARCFAVFVREEGLTQKRTITCQTMKGIIAPTVEDDGRVTVDMGRPRFAPQDLCFEAEGVSRLTRAADTLYQIRAAGEDTFSSLPALRSASTSAFCRLLTARTQSCASTSAAWAKRLPAAPGRARRSSRASGAGRLIMRLRLKCAAAGSKFPGLQRMRAFFSRGLRRSYLRAK